ADDLVSPSVAGRRLSLPRSSGAPHSPLVREGAVGIGSARRYSWRPRMAAARREKLGYAFVAPTLLFLVAFNVFPLVYNLVLGFTNAELVGSASEWHGTANYARIFEDPGFAQALRRTALFVACAVTIE